MAMVGRGSHRPVVPMGCCLHPEFPLHWAEPPPRETARPVGAPSCCPGHLPTCLLCTTGCCARRGRGPGSSGRGRASGSRPAGGPSAAGRCRSGSRGRQCLREGPRRPQGEARETFHHHHHPASCLSPSSPDPLTIVEPGSQVLVRLGGHPGHTEALPTLHGTAGLDGAHLEGSHMLDLPRRGGGQPAAETGRRAGGLAPHALAAPGCWFGERPHSVGEAPPLPAQAG